MEEQTEAVETEAAPAPTTSGPRGVSRLTQRPTRTTDLTLALDPNDAERLSEARSKLRQAESVFDRAQSAAGREGADASTLERAAEATDALDEAKANLDAVLESMVTFTVYLRGIGPRRQEELLHAHAPTQQQRTRAKALANGDPKAQPQFNEDTYPPALLAEAIERIVFSDGETIEGLSVAQMSELWMGTWSQGDKIMLLQAAQILDQAPSSVGDLGKG
jgi:hypothetical protein